MKRLTLITLALILFAFTVPCYAAEVSFGWNKNLESDLGGYRLYQSATSGEYGSTFVDEIPAGTQTYTQQDVAEGTHFWVLTAFDLAGNESDYSNEVVLVVDETPPEPPTGFWAIIKLIISWLMSHFGFHARVV